MKSITIVCRKGENQLSHGKPESGFEEEIEAVLQPQNSTRNSANPRYAIPDDRRNRINWRHLFQESIEALFSVSYKTKFSAKKSIHFDYTVMPLEGLWWADAMDDFVNGIKENWKWTLMIMQPDEISHDMIQEAIADISRKKDLETLRQLTFQRYPEGTVAQILHVGPFADEHKNILKLHKHIEDNGGSFDGKVQKHHEIYLSDFRKVDPSKMRTILRQPFS